MAITITQQPDADSHFSAFHPLPIICTSDDPNIVNIKARIFNQATGYVYATLRKPVDIGTTDTFTIDIYAVIQSIVGKDVPFFGVHSICTDSLKYIYVYLDEEILSGGVLVSGGSRQTNNFYVHNSPILIGDVTPSDFSQNILTNQSYDCRLPIGKSDSYYIQAIKQGPFDHVKFNVTYDDGTTDVFNDPIPWSDNERWNISCGTFYLINTLGAASNISMYSVYIADSGNVEVSNPVHFKISNFCMTGGARLMWLNQRGSWDAFTFKTKLRRSIETKKEFWTKRKPIGYGYSIVENREETGLFKDDTINKFQFVSEPQKSSVIELILEVLFAKVVYSVEYYPISATTGGNLVVNGGFISTSNWTILIDSWAAMAITANKVVMNDPTGDAVGTLTQAGILTIGVEYKITAVVSNNNGVQISVEGDVLAATNVNGSVSLVFTATSADLVIEFSNGNSAGGVHFDNVTVYQTAYYQGSVYSPVIIDDGEFPVVDQVKRENKLDFILSYANKNFNGIG